MILSPSDYMASAKQKVSMSKTGAMTTVATGWFSPFAVAGNPGAGTLAGSSVAAGVVPTDAVAGYPPINAFGGGARGALMRAEVANSVACRIAFFDRLWLGGAYPFNAAQALAAQPSYAGRLPNTDYKDLELWVEQVTAATLNQAVNVTYTNEAGTGSRTTGAVGIGSAPTVGRCWQLPLQAGDAGIQKVDNVAGTVASAGTFNVMVLRPLFSARVRSANDGDVFDFLKTGMAEIYADSALYMMVAADSTSLGLPECQLEVANL